jgi:hypothetical protein
MQEARKSRRDSAIRSFRYSLAYTESLQYLLYKKYSMELVYSKEEQGTDCSR